MQNPSVAVLRVNDPTIAKDCVFAQRWGYDGLLIGNVCAYRATQNKNLPKSISEAVGPENLTHLVDMAADASMIVMAYGQLPKHLKSVGPSTAKHLRETGFKLHALRLAKDGQPWHPLYLPGDSSPKEWDGD